MAKLSEQLKELGSFEKELLLKTLLFEIELGTCDDSAWLFDSEQEREFYKGLSKMIEGEIAKTKQLGKQMQDTTKALEILRA